MIRSQAEISSWYRDAPEPLLPHLLKSDHIVRSFLRGLGFIIRDTARDPSYLENHLLTYLSNDLIESLVAILTLLSQGAKSVARRELRFVLETSLKICYVQQRSYDSTISEKLEKFKSELSSAKISLKKDLKLHMLNDETSSEFSSEVGRMYGVLSNMVHLSPKQIHDRMAEIESGATLGQESVASAMESNALLEQTLAFSLVLLLHSVPEWVAGDLMVQDDGTSLDWHFSESKFIATVDSFFDHKLERKRILLAVVKDRQAKVRF